MSIHFARRFQNLLARATRVRLTLERELTARAPNALRIVRLRRLDLALRERLYGLVRASAVRRASAPRLTPELMPQRRLAYAVARGR